MFALLIIITAVLSHETVPETGHFKTCHYHAAGSEYVVSVPRHQVCKRVLKVEL